jgi:hypothetical protein
MRPPATDRRLGAQCDALMPAVWRAGPKRLSSDIAGERQLVAGPDAPWSACCPWYPMEIGPELRGPNRSAVGRPVNEQQDFLVGVEGDFSPADSRVSVWADI